MIFMLVFFGASRNDMNYSEYVTSLSLLSLLAGTDMFCCIVVFQFRRNLILEDRMQSEPTGRMRASCKVSLVLSIVYRVFINYCVFS